jgi:hypothetical protein
MALISNQLPCRKPHRVLPSRAIAQAFTANLAVSGQYTRLFMGVLHGISYISPTNSSISVTHSSLKIRGSFSDGPGGGLSCLFCAGVSTQNPAGNPQLYLCISNHGELGYGRFCGSRRDRVCRTVTDKEWMEIATCRLSA